MTSSELRRFLARLGATFQQGKGGHLHVFLNGRRSVLPMHGSNKDLKRGTIEGIKKQLGIKG